MKAPVTKKKNVYSLVRVRIVKLHETELHITFHFKIIVIYIVYQHMYI